MSEPTVTKFGQVFISYGSYHYNIVYMIYDTETNGFISYVFLWSLLLYSQLSTSSPSHLKLLDLKLVWLRFWLPYCWLITQPLILALPYMSSYLARNGYSFGFIFFRLEESVWWNGQRWSCQMASRHSCGRMGFPVCWAWSVRK